MGIRTIKGVRFTSHWLTLVDENFNEKLHNFVLKNGGYIEFSKKVNTHRTYLYQFIKHGKGKDPMFLKIVTAIPQELFLEHFDLDKNEILKNLHIKQNEKFLINNPEQRVKVITITDRLDAIESKLSNIERFLIV